METEPCNAAVAIRSFHAQSLSFPPAPPSPRPL
jgi:hypothetical protein